VIVGRLIPAGTGMDLYHDFHLQEEVQYEREDEAEMMIDFGEDIRTLPKEVLERD
jgi:hypothetical protein